MVPRSLLLCLALAVLPMSACDFATRGDIDKLTKRIDELASKVGANEKGAPNGAAAPVPAPAPQPAAPDVAQLAKEVTQLRADVADFRDSQQEHLAQLRQLAMRDANGNYHWRFDSKSADAREQFRQAEQATAPEDGWLIINNRMSHGYYVYVNGDERWVPPNDNIQVRVHRGTVTTQLRGGQPYHWTIGAPDYQQSIDIRPHESRPSEGWVPSVSPVLPPPYYYIDPLTGIMYVAQNGP